MSAPLLVLAVGNPARGDDGLGPALADQLALQGLAGMETLVDYQLQVEHALDLLGREAVLFIDATRSAVDVQLSRVAPAESLPALSHALTPAGVLHVAQRLGQALPAAWQLAIEGEAFALGEGLTVTAHARLPRALAVAQAWWREQGVEPEGRSISGLGDDGCTPLTGNPCHSDHPRGSRSPDDGLTAALRCAAGRSNPLRRVLATRESIVMLTPPPPPAQPRNPLHGKTLEAILTELVAHYGWDGLAQRIALRCFSNEPSIASSLKVLRKTPWAREKLESLYLFMLRDLRRTGSPRAPR